MRLQRGDRRSCAWTFGAPVTDAGREGRPDEVGVRRVLAQRRLAPATRGARAPGCASMVAGRARDGAEAGDPAEVVAHEIDDHHVLGRVLGRPGEPARDAVPSPSRGAVPLIGVAPRRAGPRGAGTARGRRTAARGPRRRRRRRRARGAAASAASANASSAVPSSAPVEAQADVGLEQLALRDAAHRVAHRPAVPVVAGRRGAHPVQLPGPPLRGAVSRAAAPPRAAKASARSGVSSASNHQRPVRVQPQHVVVEARRRASGSACGPRRRRRQALDPRAEPVARATRTTRRRPPRPVHRP